MINVIHVDNPKMIFLSLQPIFYIILPSAIDHWVPASNVDKHNLNLLFSLNLHLK